MSPPRLRRLARGLMTRYAPAEIHVVARKLFGKGPLAFTRRNVVVPEALDDRRVLVLSPHPDDEVIGMGGTLARLAAAGADVTVCYLTDGGGGGPAGNPLATGRRKEAEQVAADVGFAQVFWDVRDTQLTDDEPTVARMLALLSELRPDVVFVTSLFESHYDHFAANQVLCAALAAPGAPTPDVAGYEVWDPLPYPNWIVDVSGTPIEAKDAMFARYTIPMEASDFAAFCRHRHAVHYFLHVDSRRRRAGEGHAEAFLRLSAADYVALNRANLDVLRATDSRLLSRLEPERRR
jgi:LmbE family N-acetylglucosaminyl deacetylase